MLRQVGARDTAYAAVRLRLTYTLESSKLRRLHNRLRTHDGRFRRSREPSATHTKKQDMRELLSSNYFPFGSQYYRAPSPPPEDWERDLKSMADVGFNSIKYWIQWRWNHPEENRFYWDDIDGLMDVAEKYDFKVMLNTIVDVAPAWIYDKYADASMLTLDERRIGPQTQAHRQIGGLGLCLNHDEAVEHMMRFLGEAFERYSDHPALEIWNFGSEPELTQSMSQMRLYADDAEKIGDMMCYCERCASKFRRWLSDNYGEIGRLNSSWNRNYTSFEQAELPKTRNTFNDLIDWRMFFVDTLGRNVRRRLEVCEEADGDRHPKMCHHVFIQGFPITSTANDPWNVGQLGDLHGFTQMDDPMMHDVLRSCARGKPVMSAEMLMLMGYTLDLHDEITADDVKRHIFTGIAANLKGFIFWQYRPEMLGREAPAWGLTRLDGSSTAWLEAFAECGRILQEQRDFLFDAEPPKAEVAILYHPENQIFTWAATGNEKNATQSLLGVHQALYERSIRTDFVHPKDVADGHLDDYGVVILPLPYLLDGSTAKELRDWVEKGGVLISEAYLGGWNRDEGRHATTIPGFGLHEVFQVRQANGEPAADDLYHHMQGVVRAAGATTLHPGINEDDAGTSLVQAIDVANGIGRVVIHLTKDLPGLEAGAQIQGTIVKETYFVEGADVLAEYDDGQAAITTARYGKGTAIQIGSYVALGHYRLGDRTNGALFAGLVLEAANVSRPIVHGDVRVRVDTLHTSDGDTMLILQNLEPRAVDVAVDIPGVRFDEATELFDGEGLKPVASEAGVSFSVRLRAGGVRVYRA